MSNSAFATLLFTKSDGIAHISLDRPRVLNAYNIQMRDDFSQVLAAVHDDPEVRVALITGQGRAFCAGADLTEFGTAPSLVMARQVRWERDVWGQLLDLQQPVITAVHGYCIGSGLEIMLLSDLRIAAEDTVFAMPEVHLGMVPAAGGTQTLPRNAGPSAALDLLLTGRRFDTAEALKLSLITRVFPELQLQPAAWDIARQLVSLEPSTLAAAKVALREGANIPLVLALDLELRLAAMGLGVDG
ncbi:MAG TPA: enoyl-CoA hydratase/isomerase family protein [Dehalococcoidia bacterium]|jgi:enoyl-CoA hydratase/carnithine racemase|nr:enoyl-CoA hydratase/isomerase family protein [Dehalococcoidia bacterium]